MTPPPFKTVWEALEDTPERAASLKMRADLIIAIEEHIRRWGTTQVEAAARLGISQPRLNDLLRGRLQNFSLDALVDVATKAGLEVRIEVDA